MVILDEVHGLNPSLMVCELCGTETGVAVLGRLKDGSKAPRYIPDETPCNRCKEHMKVGIILVRVEGGREGRRTNLVVVRSEAVARLFGDDCEALQKRAAFVDAELWDQIMPGDPIQNETTTSTEMQSNNWRRVE